MGQTLCQKGEKDQKAICVPVGVELSITSSRVETRRGIGQQGRAQLGAAAVVKGRGDSKWAARVVLEVGRRSSNLLPDDSGADEAALAA